MNTRTKRPAKKRAKPTTAIGTWPTPEKPRRRTRRKTNPLAIDTVPLPEKPSGPHRGKKTSKQK
jgi:hypothetical protein